jgi:uncharacterized protein involved in exopolysaccharide biosynthesis
MDWVSVGKWVAGIIATVVAAGVVLKFTVNRSNSSTSSVRITSQKGNNAGGDIIGGDSVKKTTK